MKYEIFKRGTQWYWRLKAANGKIIAQGEGYHNKGDALSTIDLIQNSGQAEIHQVEEVPDDKEELSHGY